MNSRESIIAKAVAKKLKKYLEIQRREQSFDLSDPYQRGTSPNIKIRYNNFFQNDDLNEITKSNVIKYEINKIQSSKKLSGRESELKLNMEREMAKHGSPYKVSPYSQSAKIGDNSKRKLQRIRVSSGGRVGRGQKILRRAPPQKITPEERERIVNMTTKLLVATETIALPQNRKQSRESQTSSEESFPVIPAVKRVQQFRPKSAFSDPGHTSPILEPSLLKSKRIRSAEHKRNELDDYHLLKYSQGYIVTKKPSSSVTNSSTRPKSAFKLLPKQTEEGDTTKRLRSSDEDDHYDHTSSELSLNSTPRTVWSDVAHQKSDISTQTVKNSGTQTNRESQLYEKPLLLKCDTSEELLSSRTSSITDELFNTNDHINWDKFEDMSTQTRKRSLEPKVVTYEVYVVTGNKLGASTKANVKINIFGEYGHSGERRLLKPKSLKTPFQRNQIDVFHLDSMFLGKLQLLRVGHDGASVADGWYLEKVVIKEGVKATRAFSFVCKKWLSAKEDDGQIVRDLTLTKQISVSDVPSVQNQPNAKHSSETTRVSRESYEKNRSSPVKKKDSLKTIKNNESKETAKPREYFNDEDKTDSANDTASIQRHIPVKLQPKNSSFTKKTKSPAQRKDTSSNSSESYSSSSDSEIEREKLEVEKQKRREKRRSKENVQEKPQANLGGVINSVVQTAKTRSVNRRSSSDSSRSSRKGSGRETPTKRNSKTLPIITPKQPTSQSEPPKAAPQPPPPKEQSSKLPSPAIVAEEKPKAASSVSSVTSSSASSSDDEKEGKKELVPSENRQKTVAVDDGDDDDKVEFSNKITEKKYSESSDDMYMAGFIAGIKANQDKKGLKEKESEEKLAFEEKLKQGSTIHQACEVGDLDRVKELIQLVPELKNKADERGWAPIHISCAFGHLDLVKWFSVCGVELTTETPTGYTAIHLAAMNGHVNCIMILAAMGCPISSRTVDDFTPLHLAAMSGHIECVKWLLSNRAKIDVKDVNGRTPLDLAVEYRHEECMKLLKVMKKELSRKDSVMKMLRDPNALRRTSAIDAPHQTSKGADSGVGAESNEEEEWVSDTEETSDVIGRGGDDRSAAIRRTSVQGRKQSVARKPSNTVVPPPQRRMSKQEIRQVEQLEEKKKHYEAQQKQLKSRKTSFLDSIRQEIDDGSDGLNF